MSASQVKPTQILDQALNQVIIYNIHAGMKSDTEISIFILFKIKILEYSGSKMKLDFFLSSFKVKVKAGHLYSVLHGIQTTL